MCIPQLIHSTQLQFTRSYLFSLSSYLYSEKKRRPPFTLNYHELQILRVQYQRLHKIDNHLLPPSYQPTMLLLTTEGTITPVTATGI